MNVCGVCGSEEFEKHAGYMYCAVCQTQSQDYYEQEYDYKDHEKNIIRSRKKPIRKKENSTYYDDGMWTTWEAFNHILYGMTQEIKKCGASEDFELMVFKLWAAYLQKCEAVFISKNPEKVPNLNFNFKQRDARILYNFDASSTVKVKRSKSVSSKKSNVSNQSGVSKSKRMIALERKKLLTQEYQEFVSASQLSNSNLADETLESLGKSSDWESSYESSNDSRSLIKSFRQMLSKKGYKMFQMSKESKRKLLYAKAKAKNDIHCIAKNKLLSIIYLALLMTGSDIQLGDLLRFIRESHLSYAKVTHFLPPLVKFPKRDSSYIEVISDAYMPTHLRQRKIVGRLGHLLQIELIPTPDIDRLIDRYCHDLNLPSQLADLSKKVVNGYMPDMTVPKPKKPFPSFEAPAMASIIFVMKLTHGLDDESEIILSNLAREVNRTIENSRLFVFEDWQKFLECRKTILKDFHYPTQEQLNESSFENSKQFLGTLMRESKDESRNERFIRYQNYFMEENFLSEVKEMLGALSSPQHIDSIEFQPSLTPQTSHLEKIKQHLLEKKETERNFLKVFPEEILNENFENSDLQFAFHPYKYLNLIKKDLNSFSEFRTSQDLTRIMESGSQYWTLRYPNKKSEHLGSFKEEILEKTPENFQWLIKECSRMIETNVRDLYNELLRLEIKWKSLEQETNSLLAEA